MTFFSRLLTSIFRWLTTRIILYSRRAPHISEERLPLTGRGGFRLRICGFINEDIVKFEAKTIVSHLFNGPLNPYVETFADKARKDGCTDYLYENAPMYFCPKDPLATFRIKYQGPIMEKFSEPKYYDCQGWRVPEPKIIRNPG